MLRWVAKSIHTALTAVAVLQLVERGKLKLKGSVFAVLELKAPREKGAKFDPRWHRPRSKEKSLKIGDVYFRPVIESSSQQPRQCSPGWRQWARMSSLSHPAS